MSPRRFLVFAVCLSVCLGLGSAAFAQAPKAGRAATVAEAKRVLDLAAVPLMEGGATPGRRTLAGLSYEAAGTVGKAYAFHRDGLVERGFKELPGGYASDEVASGTFDHRGFKASLSVFPSGTAGGASVTLVQHGNVDLAKLPVPAVAEPFYAGPVSVMFVTKASPDATRAACRKQLLARGWEAYGEAGDGLFFRQNAVRLTANASVAPAQDGKTMLMYAAELMSAELPAPPRGVQVQYSDEPSQLAFDFPGSMDELTAFYRKALAAGGWKATTEKPIKVELYDELIFRNPAKEMLTLRMHGFEDKVRGLLKFDSAGEVARQDRLAEEKMKARTKDEPAEKAALKLTLVVPSGATGVRVNPDRIEFRVANGKAKGAVERLAADLKKQGWEGEVEALEEVAGAVSLSKGDGSLTIHYTDTGFLPAEVTIDATGVKLERGEAKE